MKKENLKRLLHDFNVTIGLLALTTGLTFILLLHVSNNPANAALFYIIGIITIANCTNSYLTGIFASLCGIIALYYFFAYFSINYSMQNYPTTFSCMMVLFVIAGYAASHIKQQALVLSAREKQLMEAEKEKLRANLLRTVSHDLRTPLTGILGASASLEEKWENYKKDECLELVHNIHDDADWLLNMVENLLSVTQIQTKNSKLNMSPEILDEVVAEAVTRLKKRMPDVKIDVEVPMEILMIPMDAMLIEQVLINLMENALTHSHGSRPIRLVAENQPDHIQIRVIDYGVGLNEDQLEHIFDGTYSETAHSDVHKGMGIGLSLCHSIITAHHGTISARNHEEGAEFLFTLPKEGTHE